MKFIPCYIGVAIAVSFLALFQYSNGTNQYAWDCLFIALSFMIGATFYYYNEWKSMREFSDIIDNTTLAWERANRRFSSTNTS
jgi:peptidoglycan/LPS O-acetylase OafA/YrhL